MNAQETMNVTADKLRRVADTLAELIMSDEIELVGLSRNPYNGAIDTVRTMNGVYIAVYPNGELTLTVHSTNNNRALAEIMSEKLILQECRDVINKTNELARRERR